ncbi:hypothetical protein ElyMa_001519300 [Elysia marginata]|uniref:Uncharacterized protein n=1 Tax=Elysia marginata TaxID=1093978 RepID=A0AAV4J7E7_9GAST|nr:hypothetical protein ElyMa_001519300 [Elysia marginata]
MGTKKQINCQTQQAKWNNLLTSSPTKKQKLSPETNFITLGRPVSGPSTIKKTPSINSLVGLRLRESPTDECPFWHTGRHNCPAALLPLPDPESRDMANRTESTAEAVEKSLRHPDNC